MDIREFHNEAYELEKKATIKAVEEGIGEDAILILFDNTITLAIRCNKNNSQL